MEKQKISYNDLNSLKLFEEISSHDAYFLLSLGDLDKKNNQFS